LLYIRTWGIMISKEVINLQFIRNMAESFSESFRSLKKVKVICCLSMLIALGVVLDFTSGIYLTPEIKVTFSFVAYGVAGALLGPVPAMICGALVDVIMWLIKPAGAFFPGYTLSAALTGLIFGVFLYKANGRSIFLLAPLSKLCVNVFINILLNTCWLRLFTGKAYIVLLGGRIIKNIAALPVEALILIFITMFVSKNRYRLMR